MFKPQVFSKLFTVGANTRGPTHNALPSQQLNELLPMLSIVGTAFNLQISERREKQTNHKTLKSRKEALTVKHYCFFIAASIPFL